MRLKLLLLFFFISFNLKSQFTNYSQFYSSPLNLNPAMTGLGEFGRLGVVYRNQWPQVSDGIYDISSWIDYNFLKSNFSVGLNFSKENKNILNLKTSIVSPSLSYELKMNYKWVLRYGIQFSLINSNLNSSDLIFFDQLNQNGTLSPTLENFIYIEKLNLFSISSGLLAYSENIWGGVSIYNLNRPNLSYVNSDTKLERLYSFHFGLRDKNLKLSPSIHFKKISTFYQLDLGTYFDLNPLSFGIWYRGIPIDKKNFFNSLIGSVSLKQKNINISYSYDYNISSILSSFMGSHEISIIYDFNFFRGDVPPKNVRYLQCPIPNF